MNSNVVILCHLMEAHEALHCYMHCSPVCGSPWLLHASKAAVLLSLWLCSAESSTSSSIFHHSRFHINFLESLFPAVAHAQDCTFGTNKYGLPLSIIVGVNGESK
jgi:hypothetical protein